MSLEITLTSAYTGQQLIPDPISWNGLVSSLINYEYLIIGSGISTISGVELERFVAKSTGQLFFLEPERSSGLGIFKKK